jgi:hypothetical protein
MIKLRQFNTIKLFELLEDACRKEKIYWAEQKTYPDTASDLVTPFERDEMVSYYLEVCEREDMSLTTETFSLFVILLDRFLTNFKVKSKYLECLALACLYIACKVKEEDDNVSVTSEFLLDCDAKCSVGELLRMELMVLTKFEWNLNDATHADFIYIYHAILVNKYKELNLAELARAENATKKLSIRMKKHTKSFKLDNRTPYLPADLNIMHLIEPQLKQLLCVNDLIAKFRPHLIAYSLISLQMDKLFDLKESDEYVVVIKDNADEQNDSSKMLKQAICQLMSSLRTHSDLNECIDLINECKKKY